MSKKGKEKGRKQKLIKLTLAAAILDLLIKIVELISKIFN